MLEALEDTASQVRDTARQDLEVEVAEMEAARQGQPMPLGGKTWAARVDFNRPRRFPAGDAQNYQGATELVPPGDAKLGANCVSSLVYRGLHLDSRGAPHDDDAMHMPALDLDVPVEVYPSSQPGHWHVYLHKEMPHEHYMELLTVMSKVGLIEPGFALAAQIRGYSALRMPWVKKSRAELTEGSDSEVQQNVDDLMMDPA